MTWIDREFTYFEPLIKGFSKFLDTLLVNG